MQLIRPGEPRRFVQLWVSEATGAWVRREGVVGRAGQVTELGLAGEATAAAELAAPYLAEGFAEVDDAALDWLVVQWASQTKRRDDWLVEHAGQWLAAVLDERGLGYVDGHDRGKRGSDGALVLNVYVRVADAEAGRTAVLAALRQGRADEKRASIAHRAPDGAEWTVRHERTSGRLPGGFSL
ncbi:hypothetical protein ABFU82_17060 [Nocardioides sp. WV_118_6]